MDDPLRVTRFVMQWPLKPREWRKFAKELLIILENIRPLVLLDEIFFSDLSALNAFLLSFAKHFDIRLCLLLYTNLDLDYEFQNCSPSLFLGRTDALKDYARTVYSSCAVFVLLSDHQDATIAEGEDLDQILQTIGESLRKISSAIEDYEAQFQVLELNHVTSVSFFPTLVGHLLQYPVIYVLRSTSHQYFQTSVDVTVHKIVIKTRSWNIEINKEGEGCQLFSFSVPSSLTEPSVTTMAIQSCLSQLKVQVQQSICWEKIELHVQEVPQFVLRL